MVLAYVRCSVDRQSSARSGQSPPIRIADILAGRYALKPDTEIILLELDEHEVERGFTDCRSPIRKAIAPLAVNVEYTDIYSSVCRLTASHCPGLAGMRSSTDDFR